MQPDRVSGDPPGEPGTPSSVPGQVNGPFGVVAEAPAEPPPPEIRDAEGLTPALASVKSVLQQEGPQPIDSAPREAGAPVLLYCPVQGGWHVGKWQTGCEPACWVAALDRATTLTPTYWLEAPPEPA